MRNNNNLEFQKFTQEAHEYFNRLSEMLHKTDDIGSVFIAWRSVIHTIRDRIHISESFHIMSQLPLILKGYYTEGWEYSETPPLDYETMEEMTNQVEEFQRQYGEFQFDWEMSTKEIIKTVVDSLEKYLTEGQIKHIKSQMPKEIKSVMA